MQKNHRNSWKEGNIVQFLVVSMKGISQVILIENALTGIIILIAISCSSIVLGIITLLSSIIGTFIGKLGGASEAIIKQGLFGYNSVLTGIALTLFMSGPFHWIISLIGAAIAAIVTAAMMHMMKSIDLPVLTAPFIILTWFILLVTYKLKAINLSKELVPQDLSNWKLIIEGDINWVEGTFSGIGQIFFLDNTLSGILLFIAVFLAGWRIGLIAVIGNVVALLVSYWLEGEHLLIYTGLYGYNAILASLAVGAFFTNNKPFGHLLLSSILAAILSVPLTASVTTWLLPYGLPALTMPFVISTWIVLGARKILPRL
ncbi:urea transporter [Lederbergia wuyishanensis]|uniref:Urea transporter n=1 Tax=Lederbergia wuyishanensis TaxID=1347903 RepID=A0ABU0D5E0_9BACI|nr:urea transporter [Lederbergia wuyishanensis]MCJ8009769.1 urea transporter [Lederbergia wuyishanensis]MDQ0343624.1 urea transporter [Lederbergia wuyishanensis]